MAKDFNQAIVMGNLTRDPELRTTPSGQSVASFSVATNRSWQDQQSGDRKDAVEFHNIVAWGKLGELVSQYLTKGRRVMVVGRLQTQSWETDGVKKSRTEIVASDINFIGGPGDGGGDMGGGEAAPARSSSKKSDDVEIQDMGSDEINLDDIPF